MRKEIMAGALLTGMLISASVPAAAADARVLVAYDAGNSDVEELAGLVVEETGGDTLELPLPEIMIEETGYDLTETGAQILNGFGARTDGSEEVSPYVMYWPGWKV